jgi:hypothetical protein
MGALVQRIVTGGLYATLLDFSLAICRRLSGMDQLRRALASLTRPERARATRSAALSPLFDQLSLEYQPQTPNFPCRPNGFVAVRIWVPGTS